MNDIANYEDIERLVSAFYHKLLADPITQSKFDHLDINNHLPKIVDFWAFILLDKPGFTENVFLKHVPLNLEPKHFDIWMGHWDSTVKEMFQGPKADLAIQRAQILSYTFQSKLFNPNPNQIL